MKTRYKEKEREREGKYFRVSQCQTPRAKWILEIFLGSLFIVPRGRERKREKRRLFLCFC